MPFNIHHHSSSVPGQSNVEPDQYTTTNALFQASQTLGSIGAPTTLSRNPGLNTVGNDGALFSSRDTTGVNGANNMTAGYAAAGGSAPITPANRQGEQFETPHRAPVYARQPEELHMLSSGSAMEGHHYQSSSHYNPGEGLSIHLQQSTPQYNNASAGTNVPGALQPGSVNRPTALASNTAPGSIPTLPQLSTQAPQTARSVTINHTHSYSRSSPAGMDQPKYKPFTNTPEGNKFSSPNPSYVSQMSQGAYSPLGLADIRPRANTGMSDEPMSPTIFPDTDAPQYPTNSNYLTPWPIYAVDWCKWSPKQNSNQAGKIALGSYLEDNHNFIQILDAQRTQPDPDGPHGESGFEFIKTAEATHSYPVTRILWEPPSSNKSATDLLATSGDHLRLWSLPSDPQSHLSNSITRSTSSRDPPLQKLSPLALLSNSKSPEHTAPITSLDWNVVSPSLIITSSIDTTCTIWDIPSLTAKTQLIAHDKEVFDVRFCAQSVDVFVSCGADGSVRMFDLRSLEHSTIIYEPSEKNDKSTPLNSPGSHSPTTPGGHSHANTNTPFPPPLLRISASPHDAHLLATISTDSPLIRILDVRQPGQALLELRGHGAAVNCIEWSPNRRGMLASGGDDSMVLIWDLMSQAGAVVPQLPLQGGGAATSGSGVGGAAGGVTGGERGPLAAWPCEYEVSNLTWAPVGDTLGVCGGRGFWGVQM